MTLGIDKEPADSTDQAQLLNHLLRQAQAGDSAALDHLCRDLQVRLRPILQSRLWGWSATDLDDIMQNTLLVFIERLPEIRDNPHFVALTILRFKIGDALRGSRRQPHLRVNATDAPASEEENSGEDSSTILVDPDSEFADRIGSREVLERLRAAIASLPTFCRAVFTAMLEERAIKEVWELFQESEPQLTRSAFDKRIFDCRRRLRRIMGEVL